jgi:RNA exonuclease NGL2
MLYSEVLSHAADILCLQEVDRLEKLFPVLEDAGYSCTYAAAPNKKHGCLIAYRKDKFTKIHEKVVNYDDEEVRTCGDDRARRGCSFRTKNIGSILALRGNDGRDQGVIVATTHLFWHPKYVVVVFYMIYPKSRTAGTHTREQG